MCLLLMMWLVSFRYIVLILVVGVFMLCLIFVSVKL